jgi:hypothetical protein
MISYLGEGLNITISCDYLPGHNWMSYLCWYSINQNLPDAKVNIVCKRNNVSGTMFLWTKKIGIPFKMYNGSSCEETIELRPTVIVPPYCMCVRDFEESGFDASTIKEGDLLYLNDTDLVSKASSDDPSSFCSYKRGWGHFITADWIHKEECPLYFLFVKKFSKQGMSLNERKIESLWNASLKLFQTISGGVLQ